MGLRDAVRQIGNGPVLLIGSGANALCVEARAAGLDAAVVDTAAAPEVLWVARLGLAASRSARWPSRSTCARPTPSPRITSGSRAADPRPTGDRAETNAHSVPDAADAERPGPAHADAAAHGRRCTPRAFTRPGPPGLRIDAAGQGGGRAGDRPRCRARGFVLSRTAADEAEILTIAVARAARRAASARGCCRLTWAAWPAWESAGCSSRSTRETRRRGPSMGGSASTRWAGATAITASPTARPRPRWC